MDTLREISKARTLNRSFTKQIQTRDTALLELSINKAPITKVCIYYNLIL